MIKAVILDFGGVVFKNKPKETWIGTKGTLDVDPKHWDDADLGLVDDVQLFDEIGEKYNVSGETIKEWLFSRREANIELLDLLHRLKPEIKLAILNNGIKTLFHGYLDKYNIKEEFDVLVNSAEEGVKKPDPKIYLITCERLGVKPEECFFIDDDQKNLESAEKVGMKSIYFTNVDTLKPEFKKLDLI